MSQWPNDRAYQRLGKTDVNDPKETSAASLADVGNADFAAIHVKVITRRVQS